MEIENVLEQNNLEIAKEQSNFFNTTFGKIIDNAIDIGIRYVLPNVIEDEVIDVKNSLIQNGLKEAVDTAIEKVVSVGKSAVGIVTGNFENVDQIRTAVKAGGIIDTVSDVIDKVVDKAQYKGTLNYNISNLIKQGKNVMLENLSSNLENTLSAQENEIKQIKIFSNIWKEKYSSKDFKGMEEAFEKIQKNMENVVPIEETIITAREIEAIHNLIKNNGQNFNISQEELQTAINLSR